MAYCWTYSKKRLLPNKELTLQREIRIILLTTTETTLLFSRSLDSCHRSYVRRSLSNINNVLHASLTLLAARKTRHGVNKYINPKKESNKSTLFLLIWEIYLLDLCTQYVVCISVALDEELAILDAFGSMGLAGDILHARGK